MSGLSRRGFIVLSILEICEICVTNIYIYICIIVGMARYATRPVPSEVSHEMAADLAAAIVAEVDAAFGAGASGRMESCRLLREMERAHRTGHAASGTRNVISSLPSTSVPFKVSEVDVGFMDRHPVILPSDYVKELADMNRLDILTGGQPLSSLTTFWKRYRLVQPNHPLFALPEATWNLSIPIFLIADEGPGYKKSAVMVMGAEPVLGYGCEAQDEVTEHEVLKMNFKGSTYKTRFLYTVMMKTAYMEDAMPLHALVDIWSSNLATCFEGVAVRLHGKEAHVRLITLGLKGDWAALEKIGRLMRNFGAGICHLCAANTRECPSWHEHRFEDAAWVRTMATASNPWRADSESGLTRLIPWAPEAKQQFFIIDLFHTAHKGFHADLSGSALVS